MHRRKILAAVLTSAGAIFSITSATKPASAATTDGSKVVYHLTDLDKVDFVLGNIRNHFDGVGGPNKVTAVSDARGDFATFLAERGNGDLSASNRDALFQQFLDWQKRQGH